MRLGTVPDIVCNLAFSIMKYWNINEILPYQRNFNLINGPREIGKTYTTLKWLIKQAVEKDKEFVYICRTQSEKNGGILEAGLSKVLQYEYPGLDVKFSKVVCYTEDKVICRCVALSEYMKIKKHSFPNVWFFIFDEYMLETSQSTEYVQGWNEPDLLLNIYHTIDRGQDRLKGFMLGNNTNFYNPYHIHDAFNIPYIEAGKIWTSKNVLFQRATPTIELSKELASTKINQQISNTKYGSYSVGGNYVYDSDCFIGKLDESAIYQFTVSYNNEQYGVYTCPKSGICVISNSIDNCCPYKYALTLEDHAENTLLISRKCAHLKWLGTMYKRGIVKFTSQKIKAKCNEIIRIVVKL